MDAKDEITLKHIADDSFDPAADVLQAFETHATNATNAMLIVTIDYPKYHDDQLTHLESVPGMTPTIRKFPRVQLKFEHYGESLWGILVMTMLSNRCIKVVDFFKKMDGKCLQKRNDK